MKKLNKIYICGSSMTGKAQMMQLIDGHFDVFTFPYHNFGVSFLVDNLKEYIINNKKTFFHNYYFDDDLKFKLQIDNSSFLIPISTIIDFIISQNTCFVNILETHFSKKCHSYVSDNRLQSHDLNFDFTLFLENISKNLRENIKEIISPEDLENNLFKSFLSSIKQDNININSNNILLCGSNTTKQISNLNKYFKNYKILIMQRELIDKVYSISLRNYYNKYSNTRKINENKFLFTLLLFSSSINIVKKDLLYSSFINKLSNKNIKFVDFNQMFKNRNKLLEEIYNFLNIENKKKLFMPSLFGEKIIKYDQENQYIDDPLNLYSSTEINIIKNILSSKILLFFISYFSKILFQFYK